MCPLVETLQVKGMQPMLTPDDCFDAEEIAKADAGVRTLLAARGITDLSLVVCDPWSVVRSLIDLNTVRVLCLNAMRRAPRAAAGDPRLTELSLSCATPAPSCAPDQHLWRSKENPVWSCWRHRALPPCRSLCAALVCGELLI